MGGKPETDSESTSSQPHRANKRAKPQQHTWFMPTNHALQENPEQWGNDLARLRPDILQQLLGAVQTEVSNRQGAGHTHGGAFSTEFGNLEPDGAATDSY